MYTLHFPPLGIKRSFLSDAMMTWQRAYQDDPCDSQKAGFLNCHTDEVY